MNGNVYVAPHGSLGEVRQEGSDHLTSLHRNKDAAVRTAQMRASKKKKDTTVIIVRAEFENK